MSLLFGYSAYRSTLDGSLAWGVVAITQLPAFLYLMLQNIFKFRDRDPKFRLLFMTTLFGLLFQLIRFAEKPGPQTVLPLAASLLFLVAFSLVVYWIPRIRPPKLRLDENTELFFPDFVLTNEKGDPVTLKELPEQPLLFIFYRGWCPLCMAQISQVAHRYHEIADLGVQIVLVSNQSHEETRKLAKRHDVDFIYLVDDRFALAEKLSLRHKHGTPAITGKDGPDSMFPTIIFTDDRRKIVFARQTDNYRVRPEPDEFIRIIRNHRLNRFLEEKVRQRTEELETEKKKSERLLLNILPAHTAQELIETGRTIPRQYRSATILFTDFKDFTRISSRLSPETLINELNEYFVEFDRIIGEHRFERIKTIGDAYMAAGGIPVQNRTSAIDGVLAALKIRDATLELNRRRREADRPVFELRIGINTGEIVAGVVGSKRFAYDIWGDAVNLASRMEGAGHVGRINISQDTYDMVRYFFDCEVRGEIEIKNRGVVEMYFVNGLKRKYLSDAGAHEPNDTFKELYRKIENGARIASQRELVAAR